MISAELIDMIYEAASIKRWNDHVRPVEFVELDKQAHKMIIAWVLAKFEVANDGNREFDWTRLIEGALFEFLQRVVLTDIKPHVCHQMMQEKGEELNRWVLEKLAPAIRPLGDDFLQRFKDYLHASGAATHTVERRILRAAHYLSTQWEFNIIYGFCKDMHGIERTREEISKQLEDHYDLIGVQKIALRQKAYDFINLCGQLRFQRRWSLSPRVPETSVLGHMLTVALQSYFVSLHANPCPNRMKHTFFGGLFHDLPEVLTRDIASPIKGAVGGLDDIIKEYERLQMEENVLPLLPEPWRRELRYYTEDEFSNKANVDGRTLSELTYAELNEKYNRDECDPIDGEIIRACDHLSAFVEVCLSIQHGIRSKHLLYGRDKLMSLYDGKTIGGMDFGRLYHELLTASES